MPDRVTNDVVRRPALRLSALRAHRHAQFLRYASVGATVALTYLGLTLALSGPAGWSIQVAIPIAYVTAVALHFTLQRLFVFRSSGEFALATHQQIGRYVIIGTTQYALTAGATALLPGIVHLPERVVYLCTVALLSLFGFLLLRSRVFHAPGA